ncbi:MAG: peptidylprolyl isomerase [Clostridiales Family XIII bacterium]|jgi:parvulin-like peptidyl-prolyl isomerase|nr:peptidylprolyl isomerase [Clostridiales Family XIII bacterium]
MKKKYAETSGIDSQANTSWGRRESTDALYRRPSEAFGRNPKRGRPLLAVVLSALLLLSGCGGDNSEIVANVGDTAITENRLNAFTELLFALNGYDLSAVDESEKNLYKSEALATMVQAEALAQHYKNQGVLPEGIEEGFAQFKDDIAQVEGLADSFKKKGVTDDTLRYLLETQFYFQSARAEATKDETLPTDAEIRAYYLAHEQEYGDEEERRVSHILVGDASHSDADRQLAEEIRDKIARGEKSFEDMAQEYGQDGTSSAGGDLGYAVRDAYVPEFSDVAFTLPQDELSEIVESEFGFHVLKVTDIRNTRSLDAQREAIRTALADELYEDKLDSIAAEFEAVYPSDNYPAPGAAEAEIPTAPDGAEAETDADEAAASPE